MRPLQWVQFDKCVLGAIDVSFLRLSTIVVFDTTIVKSWSVRGIHCGLKDCGISYLETHNLR